MSNHPNRKTEPREGYWFSDKSGVLPHGDGREYTIGKKLSVKGTLVICQNALHGSFHPFDALKHAHGEMLHKVLFSGARKEVSGKVGSRSRTIIKSADATDMLFLFARKQALTCASAWDMPAVVREFLETGDPALRVAARSAAEGYAWSDAWSADEGYAKVAALSAAKGPARSAARRAARSAARSAAWGAAKGAPDSAAWSAAWSAADIAAWNAARELFGEMTDILFS